MNIKDFEALSKERFASCEKTLFAKNKEYAEDGDKLSNFKQAGLLKGETPERALWGMLAKHLISIKKIIYDLDKGIIPSRSILAEKVGDVINYHLLLEGLVEERRNPMAIRQSDHPPAQATGEPEESDHPPVKRTPSAPEWIDAYDSREISNP